MNYGSLDTITEAVGIALYSAVQLLRGIKELGTFIPNALENHHVPLEADSNSSSHGRLKSGIGGLGRISRAAVKTPINAGVVITQEIYNAPRYCGVVVRRNEPVVTGFGSGLKAGGKVSDLLSFDQCFIPDASL